MHEFDEHQRDKPAQRPQHQGFQKQELGELRQGREVVVLIGHTPIKADLIRHDAGDNGRKQKIMADTADRQHFDAIDRARDRRAEHAGKTGADAAGDDALPQFGVQV